MAKPVYVTKNAEAGGAFTSDSAGLACNIVCPGPAWHWPYHANTGTGAAPTISTMYLTPLFPGKRCTLTNLAYEITTQGTGTGTQLLRAGIYEADTSNGRPTGAALVDFGTVDLEATTGVKNWDITDQVLDAKLYWFGSVKQTSGSQSTASQIKFIGGNAAACIYTCDTASTPGMSTNFLGYLHTGVTGALPTISSLTGHQGTQPLVLFKFA
jgi:hypothetical protein